MGGTSSTSETTTNSADDFDFDGGGANFGDLDFGGGTGDFDFGNGDFDFGNGGGDFGSGDFDFGNSGGGANFNTGDACRDICLQEHWQCKTKALGWVANQARLDPRLDECNKDNKDMLDFVNARPTLRDKHIVLTEQTLHEMCNRHVDNSEAISMTIQSMQAQIDQVNAEINTCRVENHKKQRLLRIIDWKTHHNQKLFRTAWESPPSGAGRRVGPSDKMSVDHCKPKPAMYNDGVECALRNTVVNRVGGAATTTTRAEKQCNDKNKFTNQARAACAMPVDSSCTVSIRKPPTDAPLFRVKISAFGPEGSTRWEHRLAVECDGGYYVHVGDWIGSAWKNNTRTKTVNAYLPRDVTSCTIVQNPIFGVSCDHLQGGARDNCQYRRNRSNTNRTQQCAKHATREACENTHQIEKLTCRWDESAGEGLKCAPVGHMHPVWYTESPPALSVSVERVPGTALPPPETAPVSPSAGASAVELRSADACDCVSWRSANVSDMCNYADCCSDSRRQRNLYNEKMEKLKECNITRRALMRLKDDMIDESTWGQTTERKVNSALSLAPCTEPCNDIPREWTYFCADQTERLGLENSYTVNSWRVTLDAQKDTLQLLKSKYDDLRNKIRDDRDANDVKSMAECTLQGESWDQKIAEAKLVLAESLLNLYRPYNSKDATVDNVWHVFKSANDRTSLRTDKFVRSNDNVDWRHSMYGASGSCFFDRTGKQQDRPITPKITHDAAGNAWLGDSASEPDLRREIDQRVHRCSKSNWDGGVCIRDARERVPVGKIGCSGSGSSWTDIHARSGFPVTDPYFWEFEIEEGSIVQKQGMRPWVDGYERERRDKYMRRMGFAPEYELPKIWSTIDGGASPYAPVHFKIARGLDTLLAYNGMLTEAERVAVPTCEDPLCQKKLLVEQSSDIQCTFWRGWGEGCGMRPVSMQCTFNAPGEGIADPGTEKHTFCLAERSIQDGNVLPRARSILQDEMVKTYFAGAGDEGGRVWRSGLESIAASLDNDKLLDLDDYGTFAFCKKQLSEVAVNNREYRKRLCGDENANMSSETITDGGENYKALTLTVPSLVAQGRRCSANVRVDQKFLNISDTTTECANAAYYKSGNASTAKEGCLAKTASDGKLRICKWVQHEGQKTYANGKLVDADPDEIPTFLSASEVCRPAKADDVLPGLLRVLGVGVELGECSDLCSKQEGCEYFSYQKSAQKCVWVGSDCKQSYATENATCDFGRNSLHATYAQKYGCQFDDPTTMAHDLGSYAYRNFKNIGVGDTVHVLQGPDFSAHQTYTADELSGREYKKGKILQMSGWKHDDSGTRTHKEYVVQYAANTCNAGTALQPIFMGNGYCDDYVYLADGSYPPLLNPDHSLYNENRTVECMNRCKAEGHPYFFTRNSDEKCACANSCSSFSGVDSYKSYNDNCTGKYQDESGQLSCKSCNAGTALQLNFMGNGYCDDYVYLADGSYPPLLNPDHSLYNENRTVECMNRCKAEGHPYFFTRNSDEKCACANSCSSFSGVDSYKSYSDNCQSCPTGKYNDQLRQLSCKSCSVGKYQLVGSPNAMFRSRKPWVDPIYMQEELVEDADYDFYKPVLRHPTNADEVLRVQLCPNQQRSMGMSKGYCDQLQCPAGTVLRDDASSRVCKGKACTVQDDVAQCCRSTCAQFECPASHLKGDNDVLCANPPTYANGRVNTGCTEADVESCCAERGFCASLQTPAGYVPKSAPANMLAAMNKKPCQHRGSWGSWTTQDGCAQNVYERLQVRKQPCTSAEEKARILAEHAAAEQAFLRSSEKTITVKDKFCAKEGGSIVKLSHPEACTKDGKQGLRWTKAVNLDPHAKYARWGCEYGFEHQDSKYGHHECVHYKNYLTGRTSSSGGNSLELHDRRFEADSWDCLNTENVKDSRSKRYRILGTARTGVCKRNKGVCRKSVIKYNENGNMYMDHVSVPEFTAESPCLLAGNRWVWKREGQYSDAKTVEVEQEYDKARCESEGYFWSPPRQGLLEFSAYASPPPLKTGESFESCYADLLLYNKYERSNLDNTDRYGAEHCVADIGPDIGPDSVQNPDDMLDPGACDVFGGPTGIKRECDWDWDSPQTEKEGVYCGSQLCWMVADKDRCFEKRATCDIDCGSYPTGTNDRHWISKNGTAGKKPLCVGAKCDRNEIADKMACCTRVTPKWHSHLQCYLETLGGDEYGEEMDCPAADACIAIVPSEFEGTADLTIDHLNPVCQKRCCEVNGYDKKSVSDDEGQFVRADGYNNTCKEMQHKSEWELAGIEDGTLRSGNGSKCVAQVGYYKSGKGENCTIKYNQDITKMNKQKTAGSCPRLDVDNRSGSEITSGTPPTDIRDKFMWKAYHSRIGDLQDKLIFEPYCIGEDGTKTLAGGVRPDVVGNAPKRAHCEDTLKGAWHVPYVMLDVDEKKQFWKEHGMW